MISKKEYSNWIQVALCLGTALALISVGELLWASTCVVIAFGLTVEEAYKRSKGNKNGR
jgi:uncharacterized membrane protein